MFYEFSSRFRSEGFFDPIGTTSFYVNGGRWQPQCGKDLGGKCSHQYAYHYFTLSIILREPIVGHYCQSLEHIKNGTCSPNEKTAILGRDPGAREQLVEIFILFSFIIFRFEIEKFFFALFQTERHLLRVTYIMNDRTCEPLITIKTCINSLSKPFKITDPKSNFEMFSGKFVDRNINMH